jgi:hypothetical protein
VTCVTDQRGTGAVPGEVFDQRERLRRADQEPRQLGLADLDRLAPRIMPVESWRQIRRMRRISQSSITMYDI